MMHRPLHLSDSPDSDSGILGSAYACRLGLEHCGNASGCCSRRVADIV